MVLHNYVDVIHKALLAPRITIVNHNLQVGELCRGSQGGGQGKGHPGFV